MNIRQVRARLSEAAKQRAVQESPAPEGEAHQADTLEVAELEGGQYTLAQRLEAAEWIFANSPESPESSVDEVSLRYVGLATDPADMGNDDTILYGRYRAPSRGDSGVVSRRISSQEFLPEASRGQSIIAAAATASLRISAGSATEALRAMVNSMNAVGRSAGNATHRQAERDAAEDFGLSSFPPYPSGAADAMQARANSLERFILALMQMGRRSAQREGWTLGRHSTDQYQISDTDVRRAGQSLFSRVNDATPRACFFIGYGTRRAVVASADNGITGQVVIVRVGQGYNAPQASRLVTTEALDAVTGEMVFRYLAGRRNREVGE